MNTSVLLRALGTMVLLVGIAMGASVTLAAIVPAGDKHNTGLDLGGWLVSLTVAMVLGAVLWGGGYLLGKRSSRPATMRRREAMGLVGLGWLVCSLVAAMPYCLCAPNIPLADAIFEAVSGLTTTGATIFPELEKLPKTILMWRSVTQWVGGMGILAMFVVVLSGMTASSKTLIGAESSLANADISSLRKTMRQLWVLYSSFTLICGLGLWLFFGLTPFQAINHALTTLSTGGFSTENDSVGAAFSKGSKVWLIVFMLMGGISFPFYLVLLRKRFADLFRRFEEVWWFLGGVFFVCVVLSIQQGTGGLKVDLVDIVFNVVSVATSTGYISSDYDQWSRLGIAILLILFMIGGCSGSTSGGLKVSRVILWFRFVASGLARSFRPQAVKPIKLNGKQVPEDATGQLFLVISLFGFFVIVGTIAFHALDPGHTMMGAISAVVSALGNIGPAFAEMGPTENFSSVSPAAKILFVCLMILGRLEYVALLVVFSLGLWKRY